MLQSLGIPESDSESSDSESEEFDVVLPLAETSCTVSLPGEEQVLKILTESDWNWFEFIEQQISGAESEEIIQLLEKMYSDLICNPQFQDAEEELLQQLHDAYVAVSTIQKRRNEREADAFNWV